MRTSIYIAIIFTLIGCRTDRPPIDIEPIIMSGGGEVIISNEGNYQYGNASVSIYDPISNTSSNSHYESVNGTKLGDVCQSIGFKNGRAFIVMNNSSKIIVVNENSFEWQSDILGFVSPRYMLPINNSKAIVTELFTDSVAIVDMNDGRIDKRVFVGGETENLLEVFGKAFITSPDRGQVYILNTQSLNLIDSIEVGLGASSITEDVIGRLWVLCNGGVNGAGSLYCIDPESHQVLKAFQFEDETQSPWRLCMNASNDTMYYLNESVYKMGIHSTVLPTEPFVKSNTHNFYSVGFNPTNNELYVGDAVDYIQQGIIYSFDQSGTEKANFKTGIIPGEFYFR
jgi:hypothetical protein